MRKLPIIGVMLGCGALLAACVSIRLNEPPLVVSVSRDGETCRIVVSGERVTSDRLFEIARPSWKRRVVVIYDRETPFKCVGGTIWTLQGAGLTKIDAVIWDGIGTH